MSLVWCFPKLIGAYARTCIRWLFEMKDNKPTKHLGAASLLPDGTPYVTRHFYVVLGRCRNRTSPQESTP